MVADWLAGAPGAIGGSGPCWGGMIGSFDIIGARSGWAAGAIRPGAALPMVGGTAAGGAGRVDCGMGTICGAAGIWPMVTGGCKPGWVCEIATGTFDAIWYGDS